MLIKNHVPLDNRFINSVTIRPKTLFDLISPPTSRYDGRQLETEPLIRPIPFIQRHPQTLKLVGWDDYLILNHGTEIGNAAVKTNNPFRYKLTRDLIIRANVK